MEEGILVSVWNAEQGLRLTADMAFFATEFISHHLENDVKELHSKQLTSDSTDWFADRVTDLAAIHQSTLSRRMMACGGLSRTYRAIKCWYASAVQTAINIHLNTIGAEDNCEYPRVVPHELASMRIATPEQINRDTLWRILTHEPWLSYAEQVRAQQHRLARTFSKPGAVEMLPQVIEQLVQNAPKEKKNPRERHAVDRSIRRAYKLHNRLFGSANLRQLLRQRQLTLTGKLYKYNLTTEPGDLLHYTRRTNTGTPPIHMELLRKNDDVPLCTLCVYFKDTPYIDHLIGVSLHLRTEETELDLLRAAQAQFPTAAFYQDPILPGLKGLDDPVTAPATYVSNLALHANNDQQYGTLRDSFREQSWYEIANEMMDFPRDLLKTLYTARQFTGWEFIQQTEEASFVLEQVKTHYR